MIQHLKKNKTNGLIADYVKRCPEWLREELKPLLYDVEKDDLQRFLEYVREQFKNNQSVMLALTGVQGIGKTLSSVYISDFFKYLFGEVSIIYSKDQHYQLIESMPENSCVFYPDITLVFPSRKWRESDVQDFTNTLRVFRNLYIIAVPDLEEADISFRRVFKHISELNIIHDRRILKLLDKDKEFIIVVPNLEGEIIERYHELDLKMKKAVLSKSLDEKK